MRRFPLALRLARVPCALPSLFSFLAVPILVQDTPQRYGLWSCLALAVSAACRAALLSIKGSGYFARKRTGLGLFFSPHCSQLFRLFSFFPRVDLPVQMGHTSGLRKGTRYMFSQSFRKHGHPGLSTYLKVYKVGDIVDVKANPAVHRGMPFKFYHGRTGVVYNVTKRAVGVIMNKRVGNRIIPKRINIRVEHVKVRFCRFFP